MLLTRRKKKKPGFLETVLDNRDAYPTSSREDSLDFLVAFFKELRPSKVNDREAATQRLRDVITNLQQHPVLKQKLQRALLIQLINTDFNTAFTESGIPLAAGFWQELSDRLKHKLIPVKQDPSDFLYVLNRIFYKSNDCTWIEQIPKPVWIAFFQEIEIPIGVRDQRLQHHILDALRMLSIQVAQMGIERDIARAIPSNVSGEENPFVKQSYLVHDLQLKLSANEEEASISHSCYDLQDVLKQCFANIEFIREKESSKGTSIRQTYSLLILSVRLQRMQILTDVLDRDNRFDMGRFVDLFRILIRNENRKNSLREFTSQSVGYLAYQIAEHKGAKGNKYITSTWKEYRKMIGSAMWGGFIISFIAVFKNLLGKLNLAPFGQGFLYSINYSVGFVLIDQTGSTLATKQPAFTASAVAASLDVRKNQGTPSLHNLAITVAKISRSQIASFFGNLIIVFPGSFLLAWGYDALFHQPLSNNPVKLLLDQHPWQSFSLLYACNTGIFLFVSGLIAGYTQNKIKFGQIGERLMAHPALRASMSEKRRFKLASYVEKYAGSLAGNISLGFFLGMASVIRYLFGIPFDIRHITIAAANAGIGLYGVGVNHINWEYFGIVVAGVLMIGFINFLVSFALAFFVAVKSRGIHLKDYPEFLGILWRYFARSPMDFIRPRRRKAETD